MRVNVLGSLEFRRHGSPVIFEGSRQRTILALLLLNHNTVVPANRMMQALWRHGAPPTARKMLQNAVSQLRFVLHDTRSDDQDTAVLLTHSPGYFLRLPPEGLDLEHFRRLAEEGSARFRDEQWDSASATLRKALQVWRGPVLADLAESVSWWPEVIALEEERLKVVQEYCEASLASGHFAEVVDELEAHASSEPFRERMAGQLMRALSLSDHHADTLVVFDRARALLSRSGDRGTDLARIHRPGLPLDAEPALPPQARTTRPAGGTPPEIIAAVPEAAVPEARARTETVVAVEKDVSVLAVLTHPRHGGSARTTAAAVLRSESLRRGGEFVGEFGPYVVAVFGAGRSSEIDVPLAVGVAFTVEESLRSAGEVASVAVTTGKALIGTPSLLAGPLLDRVLDQVATCSPGTVSLCETTQWAASSAFAELQSPGWRIRTERLMSARSWSPDRLIARTREVDLMHDRWELVRRQRKPQLITLLGDPHMGKSRIVTEFHRRMGEAGVVNALMIGLSERRRTAVPASMLLARLARMCVGADRHDDPTVVLDRLAAAVDALPISPDERRRLRAQLPALAAESTAAPSRDAAVACVRLLRHTLREPTVLIIDDLHLADDWLLDTVDDLSGAGDPVPLLIVVTARQQLLDRREDWGADRRGVRTTTTTLEPLPDADMAALLRTFRDAWLPGRDGGHAETPWDPPSSTAMTALEQLIPRAGGNPGLGISLSRELVHRYHLYQEVALDEQSHAEALVPIARAGLGISSTIRAVARSCMDGLSVRLKTVLLDAAVLGAGISLFPLAVLGGVEANEVAPFLHRLVEDGFLRLSGRNSATGHPEYEFRSEILREVAYSHLPRAVRAAKHGAAADWMARSDADDRDTERALHHRWWAAALEEADRRPAAFSLR